MELSFARCCDQSGPTFPVRAEPLGRLGPTIGNLYSSKDLIQGLQFLCHNPHFFKWGGHNPTGFSIHLPPVCVPAPGQFAGHRPRRAIHTSEHPISPPSEPTFVRYLRIRGILVYRIASWFIMFMLLGLRPTVGPAAVSGSLTSFVGGINRRFARRSYRQEFVTCFTSPGVVSRLTAGSRQGSESQWTKTQRCSQAAPGAFLPMNFPQKIPEDPKI